MNSGPILKTEPSDVLTDQMWEARKREESTGRTELPLTKVSRTRGYIGIGAPSNHLLYWLCHGALESHNQESLRVKVPKAPANWEGDPLCYFPPLMLQLKSIYQISHRKAGP